MGYRITKHGLLDQLSAWDEFLKRRIHLIACGGTAMTLLGIKDSTKDIDLIVPVLAEYKYLITILKQIGYKPIGTIGWSRSDGFIFELFKGIVTPATELLESPLKTGNHILIKEFSHIFLGALNYYDLIISKLSKATTIDVYDCLCLMKEKKKEINLEQLKQRFQKTAALDISNEKIHKSFKHFLKILRKEKLG